MRVLLVDDHPIFRKGLASVLTEVDPRVSVEHCASPQGLIALLQRDGAAWIDVAIMDLHMPGFRDCEALDYLRQLLPNVPVVVVSQEEDPRIVRACIEKGACSYVPKSAEPTLLMDAMALILRGGVWLPGSSLRIVEPETQPLRPSTVGWTGPHLRVTARQRDVLRGVVQGKTNKVIGRELGISDGTVKTHLANLMAMLGVNTRTQIIYELARQGIRVEDIALGGDADARAANGAAASHV
ncbi:response regulator [Hydrogenophaga sp.]|uniref:response regulator n=1 Tax=Hydrogenophaga sp. TaxID=1904254 RepID=UPI003D0C035B